jgi:radical SAM-linked protein
MAYSAGFTPHPKVSYANAAPTGTASEAEYVEISVAQRCDPEAVRRELDAALPPGLDVLDVVEAGPGALADRLEASDWLIELPRLEQEVADKAVTSFLSRQEVIVERLTKNGVRSFDARAAVVRAEPGEPRGGEAETPGCAILRLVVRHGTPSVRPDDVLVGLRLVADLVLPVPPQVTRLAQGPLDPRTETVADPLAADRDPASRGGATSVREGGTVEVSAPG